VAGELIEGEDLGAASAGFAARFGERSFGKRFGYGWFVDYRFVHRWFDYGWFDHIWHFIWYTNVLYANSWYTIVLCAYGSCTIDLSEPRGQARLTTLVKKFFNKSCIWTKKFKKFWYILHLDTKYQFVSIVLGCCCVYESLCNKLVCARVHTRRVQRCSVLLYHPHRRPQPFLAGLSHQPEQCQLDRIAVHRDGRSGYQFLHFSTLQP
jgi:hypothetical protein